MKNSSVKITLVRLSGVGVLSQDYQIKKLTGAVTVHGFLNNNSNTEFRVGDVVPEKTAKMLATDYAVEVQQEAK